MDTTSRPDSRQDSEPQFCSVVVSPRLLDSGLYSREEVLMALGISPNTLSFWESLGLKSIRAGNRSPMFHGARTVEFLYDLTERMESGAVPRPEPKLKGAAKAAHAKKASGAAPARNRKSGTAKNPKKSGPKK